MECDAEPARLARVVASGDAELVLGTFAVEGEAVDVEHAILAGATMDAVEVQASVWTVGWAAASFGPRLRALVAEAVSGSPAAADAGRSPA